MAIAEQLLHVLRSPLKLKHVNLTISANEVD